jgi:hypothetical protein
VVTSNVAAVAATIAALAERIQDTDAALVALAESLAEAVDGDRCGECGTRGQTAALWKEYRAALVALSEVGSDDLDDDTQAFRVSVQVPRRASMGHPEES